MITSEVLAGLGVGIAGLIVIGGAYYGIIYFLDQAAKYEKEAKHYFDDK